MRLRLSLLLTAAAAMVAAVQPAAAQRDIITVQLDSMTSLMRGQGYAPVGQPQRGDLQNGGEQSFRFTARAGADYFIGGVCDGDCSDMDLVLKDASGSEIDSDRATDDVPMMTIEGASGGSYTVDIIMAACSREPCFYGVQIYMK